MNSDFPQDMPTLVIDRTDPDTKWFVWVYNGNDNPTVGYADSLPEAASKACAMGIPCGYVYWANEGAKPTKVGISSLSSSYQVQNK